MQPLVANQSRAGRPSGRSLFWLGLALGPIGLGIYLVQFFLLKQLVVPWYAPILATLGVVLMLASIAWRWGIMPIVVCVVCGLFAALCAFEWFFLLSESRLAAYTGPAQTGQKLPTFVAHRADGSGFTEKDLQQGTASVLVFFRGRW